MQADTIDSAKTLIMTRPRLAEGSTPGLPTGWNSLITRVHTVKQLLQGIGCFAVAALFVALYTMDVTLRLKGFVLPGWSMIAMAALMVGAGLIISLIRTEHCNQCGSKCEWFDAYFPLEAEQVVAGAISSGNPVQLFQIPPVPKNQMKTVVKTCSCGGCGEIAKLDMSRWRNHREETLIEDCLLTGHAAAGFATLSRQHASWRGEDV